MSWLATRGCRPEAVLSVCGLQPAPSVQDEPIYWTTALAGDWTLVWADEYEADVFDDSRLAKLTSASEAVLVCVEEHVMCSSAAYWKDGVCVWKVVHDSEQGTDHLSTAGALPSGFAEIRKAGFRLQREAGEDSTDYVFDIPIQLAHQITGFKHDEFDLEAVIRTGLELLPEKAEQARPARPWWRFW